MDIHPEDTKLSREPDAKEVYEDVKYRYEFQTPSVHHIRNWLTGKLEDDDMSAFMYWITLSHIDAIGKFLLLPQARANYEALLPRLSDYPEPSIVRLKSTGIIVDLDARVPKIEIVRTQRQKDKTATLVSLLDLNTIELEYYGAHLLMKELHDKTAGATGNSFYSILLRDVVRSSNLSLEDEITLEQVTQPDTTNFIVTRFPIDASVVLNIYTALVGVKSMGIDTIVPTQLQVHNNTWVFVYILCAWLAGTRVSLADYITNYRLGDIYMNSATPREFIRGCKQYIMIVTDELEALFD